MGMLELSGEAERNMKERIFCMPRVKTNRVSLFERFRAAVFKLIMLSAISKAPSNASCSSSSSPTRLRTHHHSSQYYSEAVADCIEFIKKSAKDYETTAANHSSDHSLQTSSSSCRPCQFCGCGC